MKGLLCLLAMAAACGGAPATRAPATPPSTDIEPAPAAAADAVAPACATGCRARHPDAPDPDGYAAYCDELCAPPAGPSAQCVSSCERSHQPGARYDEHGEYVQLDDERDETTRAADAAACTGECATVPTISDEGLAACVAACTAGGGGEGACATACDPDPYDQCRYDPCD
jgi:hypothetical protein